MFFFFRIFARAQIYYTIEISNRMQTNKFLVWIWSYENFVIKSLKWGFRCLNTDNIVPRPFSRHEYLYICWAKSYILNSVCCSHPYARNLWQAKKKHHFKWNFMKKKNMKYYDRKNKMINKNWKETCATYTFTYLYLFCFVSSKSSISLE